jgi:hypothetical protein
VRRNNIPAGTLLLAALAAGCGKPAPETGASPGVTLSPPEPSSATVASPLGAETTDYTNEMQAQTLRDEAAKMGITRFGRPSDQGSETEDVRAPLTYREGLAQTHQLALDLEARRHVIDKDKNKTVALPSAVPAILPGRKQGGPIAPPPDADGPKDPEIK